MDRVRSLSLIHIFSNTVKAGETITGVVVFERIDPNLPFTFAFEGADHKHSEFEISFNFAKQ